MIYELKLDIDGSLGPRKMLEIGKRFMVVRTLLGAKLKDVKQVKTKNGFHVYIRFETNVELDDKDIVFLQLLLLSDWRREIFNWRRVKSNLKKWNVLFKKKYKVVNGELKEVSKEEFNTSF